MGGFGANSLRAEEDLNGSLQLRLGESESDAKKEPDSLFRQCFCALSKNLFLVYSDDRSMMPLEIICLQYATVTANRDWSHAFNIDTPIVKLRSALPMTSHLRGGPTPSSPCSAPTASRSLCRRACASSTFLRDSRAEKAVI